MKSGNVIELECSDFEASKLTDNDNRFLKITSDIKWVIDLNEIEAIITKEK